MNRNEVKEQIRSFVLEFLPGESASNVRDDMPLRTSGVLDSVATLRLVSLIEQRYGIEVEAYEAGIDNFDRIDDIAAFIDRKVSGKS